MTERDITICGHGSGTPSLKNLYEYLAMRYNSKMTVKVKEGGREKTIEVRKQLIAVRRLKFMDNDILRRAFHDTYETILGRNSYNQGLRQYVYTPYKGRYYSDCSSSGCATYQMCGADIPLLNTAGMLTSSLFRDVDCGIKDGHIQRPEMLKTGDALLFAGNKDRPSLQYVGHVEYIYDIPRLVQSGWEQDKDVWRYLENGEPVRDAWRYIDGRWYVFDGAGCMIADAWYHDSTDLWYYLGADGGMLASQWLDYRGEWYYLEPDGRMAEDAFVWDPRGWCYVDTDGTWDGTYRKKIEPGPGVRIVGEQEH